MKLLDQENNIVICLVTLESVKHALIWEYIDHIDYNIWDNQLDDTEAVVSISETLQAIKFAETLEDLEEYISDINWKLV